MCIKVIAVLGVGASRTAHLTAFVESGGALGCCGCGGAPTKVAVNQAVMRIVPSVRDSGIIGDACPDC